VGAGGVGKSALTVMFIQGTFLTKVTPILQNVPNSFSPSPLTRVSLFPSPPSTIQPLKIVTCRSLYLRVGFVEIFQHSF